MTPFEKTLDNFHKSKNSPDPSTRAYWRAGQMVPVHELLPYREYNRKTQEKYPGHFNDVRAYVEKNGIDDMGILSYNPKTHRVYQSEGNTRLSVAHELGFTHVPVRVYRFHHDNKAGGMPPAAHNFSGHIPADIKPSEIGFSSMVPEPSNDRLESLVREADEILESSLPTTQYYPRTNFQVPGMQNIALMIEMVMEGTFDWSELERLYGRDFPSSQSSVAVSSHNHVKDLHDLADHHGYKRVGEVEGTVMHLHPDNHGLDIHKSGSWVHTPANATHEEDAVWGDGFSDLKHHLQSFHRGW